MKRVFDTQLIGPFAAMLLVIIIVALTTERFLYLGNLSNLFLQVSIVALIAIGSTVVIFAAGIDLSSGSMVALLTMILAQMLKFIGIPLVFALPLIFVVPMLFIAGGIISFSTGTSWGTFAILIPIGVPLIQSLGLPPSLVIAAILGGGVFGDHCSPISDTTCVSAIASGCDLLEHVKTQLPYSLFGGALALIAYFIASYIMVV